MSLAISRSVLNWCHINKSLITKLHIYDKHTNDIGSLMVNKYVIGAARVNESCGHAYVSVSYDCPLFQGVWDGKEITTLVSTDVCQHFDKGFFELFYRFYNFSFSSKSTLSHKPLKWRRVHKGNMAIISHSNFWIHFFEFLNHERF